MNASSIREFRLSRSPSSGGVSGDANGAFVGGIALLKQTRRGNGTFTWQPRQSEELSEELSALFGLPVDLSLKSRGLAAIARALNDEDIVRAQLVTLHLAIPNPLPLEKRKTPQTREKMIRLIQDLHACGLIKADWDSDEHPRWPAGAPESQGGQFAPKDETSDDDGNPSVDNSSGQNFSPAPSASQTEDSNVDDSSRNSDSPTPIPAVADDGEDAHPEDVVYRGKFHDEQVAEYAEYLRKRGFTVETEVNVAMADRSASTRIDVLARLGPITLGIEVKTGEDPFPTPSQLLIYPHMIYGESVVSTTPRIVPLGYAMGEVLPPIPVMCMYVRDPNSQPEFYDFDPDKMLKEYYRRTGQLKKHEPLVAN